MIPIGLYRKQKFDQEQFMKQEGQKGKKQQNKLKREEQEKVNPNQQDVSYVTTNPMKHTKVKIDDLVFVLAQSDPGAASDTWDDYK